MSQRKLPKGRLERIANLARLGAGTGLGLVTGSRPEKLAERAATVLSSLRGLAAKVGQMASTVEGVLPASLDAPMKAALSRLRDHTDTSSTAVITSVIEEELKAPLLERFLSFEDTPLASASIGQVHRATLMDGRLVAVKVQHPGIDRAMESDLSNVRLLERMVGVLVPKGFDVDRVFDEVAARFREELDYQIEAENQTRQRRLHAGIPDIVVPAVIATHTTRRVLTTDLIDGRTLDQVLLDCSEEDREGYARTLWRFVFRSILLGGEFNSDPHPGNYLFLPPPKVAFLDFGCVQRLSETRRLVARRAHQAAIERDESAFADSVRTLLGTHGGVFESLAISFSRQTFEPVFASPYRITPGYLRGLFEFANSAKKEVLDPRGKSVPFPPELALMNRLQFGFYSLISRLDVTVDYAAIEREILAEASPSDSP